MSGQIRLLSCRSGQIRILNSSAKVALLLLGHFGTLGAYAASPDLSPSHGLESRPFHIPSSSSVLFIPTSKLADWKSKPAHLPRLVCKVPHSAVPNPMRVSHRDFYWKMSGQIRLLSSRSEFRFESIERCERSECNPLEAIGRGLFLGTAIYTLLFSSVQHVAALEVSPDPARAVKAGNSNKRVIEEKVQVFNAILNDLDDSFVDPVDIGKLADTGFNAMLNSLDPYTEFETPKAAKELRTQTSGNYGGVGLVVGRVERAKSGTDVDPYPYVMKSLEGFAFDYGIRVGVRDAIFFWSVEAVL